MVISTMSNHQTEVPAFISCPRLLIPYNRSYPSHLEAASSIRNPRTTHAVTHTHLGVRNTTEPRIQPQADSILTHNFFHKNKEGVLQPPASLRHLCNKFPQSSHGYFTRRYITSAMIYRLKLNG